MGWSGLGFTYLRKTNVENIKWEITSVKTKMQILFETRAPQVKGEFWLQLFAQRHWVKSRTLLVLFAPPVEIRVVFDFLCGWTAQRADRSCYPPTPAGTCLSAPG